MKKYKVTLQKEEREELVAITQKGKHRSQKVLNALILLNCDEGDFQENRMKNIDIAGVLQISMRKIDRTKKSFVEEGLAITLNGTICDSRTMSEFLDESDKDLLLELLNEYEFKNKGDCRKFLDLIIAKNKTQLNDIIIPPELLLRGN